MSIRDISDAELMAAQQAIEKEAGLAGIEPYKVVALFDSDGRFAGTERIDTRLRASSLAYRRRYWNPAVPSPTYCPACGVRMLDDTSGLIVGGFMHACFNCGRPWSISRHEAGYIDVAPFDSHGDRQIENIIEYNFHRQRQERGLRAKPLSSDP